MPNTSLRAKLSDAAGWVMVACGLAAVIVITALKTSVENGLSAGLMFLGLLAGAFLSVAVHELGHAIGAWLVGWRVWIISVAGVLVRHGHGLRLSAKYSHDVGGYVLASPPDADLDRRWRSIVFTAGGPLASVLTGPLLIAWFVALPGEAWPQTPLGGAVFVGVLAFAVASSSAALATLIPSRSSDGRPNDMRIILDAIFRRGPSLDVRGAGWAWALFDHGVEPDAWPPWMHESIARSTASPWATPAAPLLAFMCALQNGDEAAAREAARRCIQPIGKLTQAYVRAYFDGDAAAAELELKDVDAHPRETSLLLLRDFVRARIAALRGDAAAARAFAAIADALNADGPKPFWDKLLARAASAA